MKKINIEKLNSNSNFMVYTPFNIRTNEIISNEELVKDVSKCFGNFFGAVAIYIPSSSFTNNNNEEDLEKEEENKLWQVARDYKEKLSNQMNNQEFYQNHLNDILHFEKIGIENLFATPNNSTNEEKHLQSGYAIFSNLGNVNEFFPSFLIQQNQQQEEKENNNLHSISVNLESLFVSISMQFKGPNFYCSILTFNDKLQISITCPNIISRQIIQEMADETINQVTKIANS